MLQSVFIFLEDVCKCTCFKIGNVFISLSQFLVASVKNHHKLSDLKQQIHAFVVLEVRSLEISTPELKLKCWLMQGISSETLFGWLPAFLGLWLHHSSSASWSPCLLSCWCQVSVQRSHKDTCKGVWDLPGSSHFSILS